MAKQLEIAWRRWHPVARVALLALMTATAGCAAQSEMTELWKDPSFTSGPVRNVFVVALRKDPVRRWMWEDAFTRELGARGLTATSSYQLFPAAAPDSLEVTAAVRKHGYDAVLVSLRLPDQTTSTFVPGAVRREAVTVRDFYGTFHAYWRDVQDPGHTEIDEFRRFQTDLWDTGTNGRLIWPGTLRTLESVSNRAIETAVSKDIVPEIGKQGLIPKRRR